MLLLAISILLLTSVNAELNVTILNLTATQIESSDKVKLTWLASEPSADLVFDVTTSTKRSISVSESSIEFKLTKVYCRKIILTVTPRIHDDVGKPSSVTFTFPIEGTTIKEFRREDSATDNSFYVEWDITKNSKECGQSYQVTVNGDINTVNFPSIQIPKGKPTERIKVSVARIFPDSTIGKSKSKMFIRKYGGRIPQEINFNVTVEPGIVNVNVPKQKGLDETIVQSYQLEYIENDETNSKEFYGLPKDTELKPKSFCTGMQIKVYQNSMDNIESKPVVKTVTTKPNVPEQQKLVCKVNDSTAIITVSYAEDENQIQNCDINYVFKIKLPSTRLQTFTVKSESGSNYRYPLLGKAPGNYEISVKKVVNGRSSLIYSKPCRITYQGNSDLTTDSTTTLIPKTTNVTDFTKKTTSTEETTGTSTSIVPTKNVTDVTKKTTPTEETTGTSTFIVPTKNITDFTKKTTPTEETTGTSTIIVPTKNVTDFTKKTTPTEETTGSSTIIVPTKNVTDFTKKTTPTKESNNGNSNLVVNIFLYFKFLSLTVLLQRI